MNVKTTSVPKVRGLVSFLAKELGLNSDERAFLGLLGNEYLRSARKSESEVLMDNDCIVGDLRLELLEKRPYTEEQVGNNLTADSRSYIFGAFKDFSQVGFDKKGLCVPRYLVDLIAGERSEEDENVVVIYTVMPEIIEGFGGSVNGTIEVDPRSDKAKSLRF